MPDRQALSFWFDVHSPWCYLASHRIEAIAAQLGRTLIWRPLHLPRLQETIKGRQPLQENAAFVAWYKEDIIDCAEELGLPLKWHSQYPLRNSRALRVCQLAAEQGRAEEFVPRIFRAYWAEEGDISDLDQLESWARDCSISGAREAALSEDYKALIETNTAEAISRGVFGVPTVDTGVKLYFGNDRLDMLVRHLRGAPVRV